MENLGVNHTHRNGTWSVHYRYRGVEARSQEPRRRTGEIASFLNRLAGWLHGERAGIGRDRTAWIAIIAWIDRIDRMGWHG